MSKPDYPPEFESQVRKAMDVPEPNANTMDTLRKQFVARGMTALKTDLRVDPASNPFRPEKDSTMKQKTSRLSKPEGKSFWVTLRTRPLMAILLALLILLALTGVAYAIGKSLGYVPGLGVVDQNAPLRVLAEPVLQTRDGVTVTVEKGTSDAQKTILRISVDGTDANGGPYCDNPYPQLLRLADGTTLEENGGYGNIRDLSKPGYTNVITFPALPAGSDDATLEIPCLWRVTKLEDWKIPLDFVPADGSGVNPVIEIPSAMPTTQATFETVPPTESPYGISLALEKVVPLDDGYLLIGSLRWTDKTVNIGPYFDNSYNLRAVDANGQIVALEEPEQSARDLLPPVEAGSLVTQWIYKVSGKQHAWPLTLTTKAYVDLDANVPFTFDPGPNPHKGQVWQLGQELTVNGHVIQLVSATWQDGGGSIASLEFDMISDDPAVITLDIKDILYRSEQHLCGGGGEKPMVIYCEALTPEPRTLTITSIRLLIPGPWQVTWQP
jgi:hypothetical protein